MTDAIHFPVRSEIREGEQPSLQGTEPGKPILRDEIAESESDPGTSIGFVHIVLTRSRAKSADVVAYVVFNFDGGEVLTATGALPFHEVEDTAGRWRSPVVRGGTSDGVVSSPSRDWGLTAGPSTVVPRSGSPLGGAR